MKKYRLLSLVLILCMVLTLAPAVLADDETPVCTCETACEEGNMNGECPVCGEEGATVTDCAKYAVQDDDDETPVCTCETACEEGNMNGECPVCGAEGATVSDCAKHAAQDDDDETPVCTCETACEEGSMNGECSVCGAEGATVTDCAKYAVQDDDDDDDGEPKCICETGCTWDHMNADCPVCGDDPYNSFNCPKYTPPETYTWDVPITVTIDKTGAFLPTEDITFHFTAEYKYYDFTLNVGDYTLYDWVVDQWGDYYYDRLEKLSLGDVGGWVKFNGESLALKETGGVTGDSRIIQGFTFDLTLKAGQPSVTGILTITVPSRYAMGGNASFEKEPIVILDTFLKISGITDEEDNTINIDGSGKWTFNTSGWYGIHNINDYFGIHLESSGCFSTSSGSSQDGTATTPSRKSFYETILQNGGVEATNKLKNPYFYFAPAYCDNDSAIVTIPVEKIVKTDDSDLPGSDNTFDFGLSIANSTTLTNQITAKFGDDTITDGTFSLTAKKGDTSVSDNLILYGPVKQMNNLTGKIWEDHPDDTDTWTYDDTEYTFSVTANLEDGADITLGGNETDVTFTNRHTHDYSLENDGTYHWDECECESITNVELHTYGAWTVIEEPTETKDGIRKHTCTKCGHYETAPQSYLDILIDGVDAVCATQDYEFTFTLPDALSNAEFGFEAEQAASGSFTPTLENGVYHGVLDSDCYNGESSFTLIVTATTAEGIEVSARKTVTVRSEHFGGTATCTDLAVCALCGEAYGETDPTNHTGELEHTAAVEATIETEGNIEYWYCADCGRYFRDADGLHEITLEETVISRLPRPVEPEKKPAKDKVPHTGDDAVPALWLAAFAVCAAGAIAVGKKKKYSAK